MRRNISVFLTLVMIVVLGWALSFDVAVYAQDTVAEKQESSKSLETSLDAKATKKDKKDINKNKEKTEKSNEDTKSIKDTTGEEAEKKEGVFSEELKEVEGKKGYEIINAPVIDVEEVEGDKGYLAKVPVHIGDETPLYLGGTNQFDVVQRALRAQNKIYATIVKEKLQDKEDIVVDIFPKGDHYQVVINDIKVFKLYDEDFEVNGVEKEVLIDNIKNSIELVIESVTKTSKKEIEKFLTKPVDFLKLFIWIIAIVVIIELLLVVINRFKKKIIIAKLNKYCIKRNERKNYIETIEEKGLPVEYEQKIEQIANQVNLIFNCVLRFIQLVLIFFAVLKVMYFYPATNEYAEQAIIFIQSIVVIFNESIQEGLGTEEARGKLGAVITIVFISGVLIYITKIFGSLISNLIWVLSDPKKRKSKRLVTITKMVSVNIQILLVAIALIIALQELGFEVSTILAGAGIAGIALSFGAQNLIKDMVNGAFIIIEDQYGIDDIIKANDITGRVEDMTLRVTVLRDVFSGVIYIIPNGEVNVVSVYTKDWASANLDVSIAYKEDVDTAIKLIKETADSMRDEMPKKIIGEPKVFGLNNLNDSSVDIKLVMKTVAGEQWSVEREFRRRIKYVFDRNNIEIPFPHRTVYMHQCSDESKENEFIISENSEAEDNTGQNN